jgi:hypothetical protein
MTTYSKTGSFGYAGGGKSGAVVDLWATSRFTGPPAENQAPPGGSPDAGPVTTGPTFGNPGAWIITGITTIQDYYVRVQYGGNTYWGFCAAGTLGGGTGDGWPTVNGTGAGNLTAQTGAGDTVGYNLTDQGTGGISLQTTNAANANGIFIGDATAGGLNLQATGSGHLELHATGSNIVLLGTNSNISFTTAGSGNLTIGPAGALLLTTLPTSDPSVSHAIWNFNDLLVASGFTALTDGHNYPTFAASFALPGILGSPTTEIPFVGVGTAHTATQTLSGPPATYAAVEFFGIDCRLPPFASGTVSAQYQVAIFNAAGTETLTTGATISGGPAANISPTSSGQWSGTSIVGTDLSIASDGGFSSAAGGIYSVVVSAKMNWGSFVP